MDLFLKMEIAIREHPDRLLVDAYLPNPKSYRPQYQEVEADHKYRVTNEDVEGLSLGGREVHLSELSGPTKEQAPPKPDVPFDPDGATVMGDAIPLLPEEDNEGA